MKLARHNDAIKLAETVFSFRSSSSLAGCSVVDKVESFSADLSQVVRVY